MSQAAALKPDDSGDIPPQVFVRSALSYALRYASAIVALLTVVGVLYTTIAKANAHELVLAEHARRIERLENLAAATYINGQLACAASGATGCVTPDQLESGSVPRLRVKGDR